MTVPPVVNDQQLASVSHARRRNRDYKRDASLDLAKQQFMSTVDAAINNLMQNCGYSRSRAISALLHEFRREVPPPTDDEVFRAMQLYGLGTEDAARGLIVSSTVLRAVRENGGSFRDAIDGLTEKLSLTNMRAMNEFTDFSDVDERPRSPDRRIEAVSTFERQSSTSRKQQISGNLKKSKVVNKINKSKSSSKATPVKTIATPKPASRKRLIDETNQGDKKVILRELSDPVRDDVDVQVAIKCKEDDGSLPDAATALRSTAQSVVPRAKRAHRVDDGPSSSQASALKRARTSDV